ncbi:polyprenyl synthetase family protein [Nocardia sp. NPDC052316]|uniref:polyprenyl synthetase family protein n=1 Tax=Nocardia sp. NPDC052316 TaxID=3364329 RepID=UPI0037CA189F
MTDTLSVTFSGRGAALLSQARRFCEPGLREAVTALPDPIDRMANYHFGWCDRSGKPTRSGWGKGLRAALVFGAAKACAADPANVAAAAVAVELMHNFTLVHDDVMDCDRLRRGRTTVWAVWGTAQAICLGDALHALAVRVLATTFPGRLGSEAVARLESAAVELCRGQMQDCAFETRPIVGIEDYLTMAAGKTGALFGCATALGALCAGADSSTTAGLASFGRELGLAFQLVDDVLGIWGDPATTGKPAGGDLIRRKQSYPVVAALASETPAAEELSQLYRSRRPITQTEATHAATLVQAAGGRRSAARQVEQRITAAITALPHPMTARDLIDLAHLVGHRDR